MKKTLLLIVPLVLFLACNKKRNERIFVKGHCMDWFNRSPLAATLRLRALEATSNTDTYKVGSVTTDKNGVFNTAFPAARSNEYFAWCETSYGSLDISMNKSGDVIDFGEIFGPHEFVCKIRAIRDPGSSQKIVFPSGRTILSTHPSDTTCYEPRLAGRGSSFAFEYVVLPSGIKMYERMYITSGDTVSATIHY